MRLAVPYSFNITAFFPIKCKLFLLLSVHLRTPTPRIAKQTFANHHQMRRFPRVFHGQGVVARIPVRYRSDKKDSSFRFATNLDAVDPSIHTMEKILSILQTAESSHGPSPAHDDAKVSPLSRAEFEKNFYSSLGSSVFDYQVTKVLGRLQIIHYYKVFREVNPETTKSIFERYTSVFKDRYIWQMNSQSNVLAGLGYLFAENPLRTLAVLDAKFDQMCKSLLVDFPGLKKNKPFKFDFRPIQFYQPFRAAIEDPLIMHKGLSMQKYPLNLLALMIDDKEVLVQFLLRSQSKILADLLHNSMAIQTIEGAQAFKILVKRILKDMDPEMTIHSPFESYHMANVSAENDSDIEIVKAIVASRSKLLERLVPYRDYKFSLLKLADEKQDNNEKIVKLLAGLFDRFFGVCYRMDAKYCNEWVGRLVQFYLANNKNEAMFERLFKESIQNFHTTVASLKLEKFTFQWVKREESQPGTPNKGNTTQRLKSQKMIHDTRALLAHSKQLREGASL